RTKRKPSERSSTRSARRSKSSKVASPSDFGLQTPDFRPGAGSLEPGVRHVSFCFAHGIRHALNGPEPETRSRESIDVQPSKERVPRADRLFEDQDHGSDSEPDR